MTKKQILILSKKFGGIEAMQRANTARNKLIKIMK